MPVPSVNRYSAEELKQGQEWLKSWNPERIQKAYLQGQINLPQKMNMLATHGQLTRELQIQQYGGDTSFGIIKGETSEYVAGVLKELKATWDAETKGGDNKKATQAFHALMTGLEVLKVYDLPGNILERIALSNGMDPSYARAVNWAAWIPAQFAGITTLLRAPFKALGAATNAVTDYASFVKNPVKYAVEQSMALGASKAAKEVIGAATKTAKEALPASAVRQGLEGFIDTTPQAIEKAAAGDLVNFYQDKAGKLIRSGISHGQTETAAQTVKVSDLLNRPVGQSLSAAETALLGRVNEQVRIGLQKSIEDALPHLDELGAGNRPDLLGAFRSHLEAFSLTNPKFLGGTGEIGRGLEYMKALQPEAKIARVYDAILKGVGAEGLSESTDQAFATAIRKMSLMAPESQAMFLDVVSEGKDIKPSIWHSLFKTLLFLNPATHVTNIAGTLTHGIGNSLEYTGAALMPLKDKGAPSVREALAHWEGLGRGAAGIGREVTDWAGLTSATSNLPRILLQSQERSLKGLEKLGLQGAPDVLARYGTGRALGYEDEILGGIWESAYTQSKIMRDAIDRGLKLGTPEMRSYFDDVLRNPERIAAIHEEVAGAVGHVTMHDPLGWTQGLTDWIRNSPVDFLAPVTKFPITSLKIGRDWTPGLNLASSKLVSDIAAGGAQEAGARARMALSWMLAQAVWGQAKTPVGDDPTKVALTGGGPRNPDANRVWQEKGNVPYSWHGHSYNWIEPFRMPIGFVADLAYLSNEADPEKVSDLFGAFTLSFERSITNNWFLRIMQGITQSETVAKTAKGFETLGYDIAKFAAAPIKTVISGGPVGRRITENFITPESKDLKFYGEMSDIFNYMIADTWFGKDARPNTDLDGNIRIVPPIMGHRWLSFVMPPIRPKDKPTSRTAELLDKWQVSINDDWKSGPGQAQMEQVLEGPSRASIAPQLTGDESYNWKQLSKKTARNYKGQTWLQALEELDQDPQFQLADQNKKQQRVDRLHHQYQNEGFKLLMLQDPNVKAKKDAADAMTRMKRGQPDTPAGAQEDLLTADPAESTTTYVPLPEAAPPPTAQ